MGVKGEVKGEVKLGVKLEDYFAKLINSGMKTKKNTFLLFNYTSNQSITQNATKICILYSKNIQNS